MKGNGARKGKQVEMDEGNKGETYKYEGIKETEVMEGKWTYRSLSTFFIRKSRPNKKIEMFRLLFNDINFLC